jgi:hypothetical protein
MTQCGRSFPAFKVVFFQLFLGCDTHFYETRKFATLVVNKNCENFQIRRLIRIILRKSRKFRVGFFATLYVTRDTQMCHNVMVENHCFRESQMIRKEFLPERKLCLLQDDRQYQLSE